jgi:hypothetical protein
MTRQILVSVALAGIAASAPVHVVHGYGMSIAIPQGWQGRITHGLVRVRGQGLRIVIRESTPGPKADPFFRRRAVPRLGTKDFRSAEHHLGFTLSGRNFAVLPFPARRPSPAAIGSANAVLRSFTVRSGHFYGEPLPPARFPGARGWFVGARSGKLLAEGGQTESWAATVPYRDPPLQIPPTRTLGRLGPNGTIIWVSLSRDSALRMRPVNSLHIRRNLISNNFEGLPRGIGLFRATVRRSAYDLDVWVFFKTAHPTPPTVARAQTELDRLRLPVWPNG